MCRFIATLLMFLTAVPLVRAQASDSTGIPAIPPASTYFVRPMQTPWLPPVPPNTPADYGRTPSTQAWVDVTLLYNGYYGVLYNNSGPLNLYPYAGGSGNAFASQSGSSAGNKSSSPNTYAPARRAREQPLASATYPNHEPLLEGLADLKLGAVHAARKDLVDARTWMSRKEIATLIASVNGNPQLYHNAERLTDYLQSRGLLHAGDRVIGYGDGKAYILSAR